jgi:uncharacterized protein (DUF2147 family)
MTAMKTVPGTFRTTSSRVTQLAAFLWAATVWPVALAAAPKEAGVWYDDTAQGAIEILQCGDKLCGRIVWLQEPLNDAGQPKMDRNNPKAENRNRPICGLQILGGLEKVEGGWDAGWIYDPKQGAAFDLALQLVGKDQLQITGYKGIKLLSKTFMWRRAPADLPRCDPALEQQTGAPPAEKKAKVAKPAEKPADGTVPAAAKPIKAGASGELQAPKPVPAKRPPPDGSVQ